MVNLIEVAEIQEIFDNFEKLKKKSEGNDTSDEARVSTPSKLVAFLGHAHMRYRSLWQI